MARHILVTGGAGFIGSHLAAALIDQGADVTVLDDLSNGRTSNIPTGATFVHGDITDKECLQALPWPKIDAVCHLAAQSSGAASFDDPDMDMRGHVLGTFRLLEQCREHNVHRFLYASSSTIYGHTEKIPAGEDSPPMANTYYAQGKVAAEGYVRFFERFGVQGTILRMPNVYGPGQNLDNKNQGMISIYLSFMLEGKPVVVKGSRDRFRDFIYIDDVVNGWMLALDDSRAHGKTYNLGTGWKTTVAEVLEALRNAFGDPDYPIEFTDGTPGDQTGMVLDITKIQNDLSFEPRTVFATGISRMVHDEKKKASGDQGA